MLALRESTEFFCNIFCSNIYPRWRAEHFKMNLADLAPDALVFLLASPAIDPERLLPSHFPHVFPAASDMDKMLNRSTKKNFNFIPCVHHFCLRK